MLRTGKTQKYRREALPIAEDILPANAAAPPFRKFGRGVFPQGSPVRLAPPHPSLAHFDPSIPKGLRWIMLGSMLDHDAAFPKKVIEVRSIHHD